MRTIQARIAIRIGLLLLAMALPSQAGRDTNNFDVSQGYVANGIIGANLVILCGHVEWRKFQCMHPRTLGGSPVCWW